jgi:2,3-dihydroxy-p-cumate/2,3-dihydroxybenzoate 3,4-dioxygenase
MVYEYSVGVKHILPEEEVSYRPRQFPFAPESFCMWGSKPDIPEFRAEKKGDAGKAPLKTVA